MTRNDIISRLCVRENEMRAENRHEIANAFRVCRLNLPFEDTNECVQFLETEADRLDQHHRKLASTYVREFAIHVSVQSTPVQRIEDTPEC